MNKPKSLRPVDITHEGPGLLIDTDAGEVFLGIIEIATALDEMGFTVCGPPTISVDVTPFEIDPNDG